MKIELYSDGSCRGNPGPGGWGCVVLVEENEIYLAGKSEKTTNQEMELVAAAEGLKFTKELDTDSFSSIILYTDSAYLYNCWKDEWWKKWVYNGWLNSKKEPVSNKKAWEELIPWFRNINVTIVKVKGHADNKYNNIADLLATGVIQKS